MKNKKIVWDLGPETSKNEIQNGLVFVAWTYVIFNCRPSFRAGKHAQFLGLEPSTFFMFSFIFLHITEMFSTGIRAENTSRFLIQFCGFP